MLRSSQAPVLLLLHPPAQFWRETSASQWERRWWGRGGQWGRYILDPGGGTVVSTGQEHWLSLLMFTAACRYSPGLRTQKSLYRDAVDIIQSQSVTVENTNMWLKNEKCVLIPCLTSTSTVHYSKALILQKHTSHSSQLHLKDLYCIPTVYSLPSSRQIFQQL